MDLKRLDKKIYDVFKNEKWDEYDGIAYIKYFAKEFDGIVKNKGSFTDLIGIFYFKEEDGFDYYSLCLGSSSDTNLGYMLSEFEEEVLEKIEEFIDNL